MRVGAVVGFGGDWVLAGSGGGGAGGGGGGELPDRATGLLGWLAGPYAPGVHPAKLGSAAGGGITQAIDVHKSHVHKSRVTHNRSNTHIMVRPRPAQIRGSLVLDATGHSRRLVQYDKKFDPGFQGAYGIVAEVRSEGGE